MIHCQHNFVVDEMLPFFSPVASLGLYRYWPGAVG